MNNTGGRRFGKIELQPSFIGKLLLRASANERLIRTGALLILAAGVAGLAVLGVSLIKPGILGAPGHILQEKASELIQHAFSSGTLKLVAAVAVVIAIDLWALGYKNSALNSLLHPDKSTRTDILIFLLGIAGLWRYAIILSFFAVGYLLERQVTGNWGQNWMQLIPSPIVQTLFYLLLYDFLDYWRHRFGHRLSWWWEVHLYHHAAEKFNIITVGRSHPIDLALTGIFVAMPMAIFGAPIEAFLLIEIFRSLQGKMQHSMIDWDWGWLGRNVFISPIAHRIHHSPDPIHWDKNYGHIFVFWDRLFGTWYDGCDVNTNIGLLHNNENKDGFIFELLRGQLRFLGALFSRWDTKVGVLPENIAREESKRYREALAAQTIDA